MVSVPEGNDSDDKEDGVNNLSGLKKRVALLEWGEERLLALLYPILWPSVTSP